MVQHLQATVDDMFSQLLLLQTAYSSRHAAMLGESWAREIIKLLLVEYFLAATLAAEPVLAATIIPRAATFLEAHTSILVQPSRGLWSVRCERRLTVRVLSPRCQRLGRVSASAAQRSVGCH